MRQVITAAELFALPPDETGVDRWLFSGQLVERWNGNRFHTPAHASTVATLSYILGNWCREVEGLHHRPFGYGCPYRLERDPDTVVSYDASVVDRKCLETSLIDAEFLDFPPRIAVEVVELDEDPDLLHRLVTVSLQRGVRSVWVVDPFERLVVCHRPQGKPTCLNGGMLLVGDPDLPGFRCPVAEIFE